MIEYLKTVQISYQIGPLVEVPICATNPCPPWAPQDLLADVKYPTQLELCLVHHPRGDSSKITENLTKINVIDSNLWDLITYSSTMSLNNTKVVIKYP